MTQSDFHVICSVRQPRFTSGSSEASVKQSSSCRKTSSTFDHDESYAREQLAEVEVHPGHHPTCCLPIRRLLGMEMQVGKTCGVLPGHIAGLSRALPPLVTTRL